MLRQIIIPDSPVITMRLPDEMVGKSVEVIAFEVDEKSREKNGSSASFIERLQKTKAFYSRFNIDMSDFKFNRDEANER